MEYTNSEKNLAKRFSKLREADWVEMTSEEKQDAVDLAYRRVLYSIEDSSRGSSNELSAKRHWRDNVWSKLSKDEKHEYLTELDVELTGLAYQDSYYAREYHNMLKKDWDLLSIEERHDLEKSYLNDPTQKAKIIANTISRQDHNDPDEKRAREYSGMSDEKWVNLSPDDKMDRMIDLQHHEYYEDPDEEARAEAYAEERSYLYFNEDTCSDATYDGSEDGSVSCWDR